MFNILAKQIYSVRRNIDTISAETKLREQFQVLPQRRKCCYGHFRHYNSLHSTEYRDIDGDTLCMSSDPAHITCGRSILDHVERPFFTRRIICNDRGSLRGLFSPCTTSMSAERTSPPVRTVVLHCAKLKIKREVLATGFIHSSSIISILPRRAKSTAVQISIHRERRQGAIRRH